jgi:hypothetical protein
MREDEKVVFAGRSKEHQEVVVQALREQAIPPRILAIKDVEPSKRPDRACTPGSEFYVVVPADQHAKSVDVLRWLSRVFLRVERLYCQRFELAKSAEHPTQWSHISSLCGIPYRNEIVTVTDCRTSASAW